MKTLRFLFSFLCLALVAQAQQRVPRTVPTVLDMLAMDPKSLATRTVGTNSYFEAVVITLGDTVAPGTKKTWWWSGSATLATNTIDQNGPLAWPPGAAAGRWLYVPEALSGVAGATLASAGAPGQIPAFASTNSIGSSGISTNQIRNISRVFPLVADMLAESPTNWINNSGGTLVWLETTGDTVVGDNPRRWKWEEGSTLATNTPAKGGPLAWPFGSSAGRFVQYAWAGMYAPTDRVMLVPPLGMDALDGTMSATDPATYVQPIWDAASAAYHPVLGRVTVDHPWGTYTGSELLIRGKVRYRWNYEWHWRKRFEPSGLSNRSVATTVRKGWINQDPVDGSFLSWGASGTNDFSIADHWYDLSDDIEFCGTGKCVFEQNQKGLILPALRLLEVRRFTLQTPGLLEVWLSAATNAGSGNSYGIQPCGRGIILNGPIVRGGTLYAQDGIHIGWGENIQVNGGYSGSGDDALVVQDESAGGFTSAPDEGIRHVRVSNVNVDSKKGRAACIHVGSNQINIPYANRTPRILDVVFDGIFGKCAALRSHALAIGHWPDGTSLQNYTITTGGTGYSNGYWGIPITAAGGGSNAWAIVKVEGNTITRCYPAKMGNAAGKVTAAGYAAGSTNIAITGGTGYVWPGDKIKFAGDNTVYTVNSVSNNAAITLFSGLTQTNAAGVAITIQTSTALWKTGTAYRQDESPIVAGFVPGGSGAVITANVYGARNDLVVDCGIQNFNLEAGDAAHDGTEALGFRVNGVTRGWIRNGRISITQNSVTPIHRPFQLIAADGFTLENVRISPTTRGGQLAADVFPNCTVDDVVFDGVELGPVNSPGNGTIKINGTNGAITIRNSKIHVGTNGPGLYLPDYENSRRCYTGRLELVDNVFDSAWTNTIPQAVDFVPNLGGVPIIGFLKSVGNTFTNIATWDTPAIVQTSLSAYDIRANTGGMRTELQIQVTQASGATNAAVPVSTYTGLLDATTASLPQIVGIVPVDYLGAWRLRANTATAVTIETANSAPSNCLWNINLFTGRKPIGTGY